MTIARMTSDDISKHGKHRLFSSEDNLV